MHGAWGAWGSPPPSIKGQQELQFTGQRRDWWQQRHFTVIHMYHWAHVVFKEVTTAFFFLKLILKCSVFNDIHKCAFVLQQCSLVQLHSHFQPLLRITKEVTPVSQEQSVLFQQAHIKRTNFQGMKTTWEKRRNFYSRWEALQGFSYVCCQLFLPQEVKKKCNWDTETN